MICQSLKCASLYIGNGIHFFLFLLIFKDKVVLGQVSWHKKSWLVNQRKEDQICSIFPLCITIVEISWILSTRETARAYQLCAFALCCNLSLRSDTFFLLINQPALFHLFHESICRNRNCRNCALSQYLEPYVAGVWLIYRLTLSSGVPSEWPTSEAYDMDWLFLSVV